MAFGGMARQPLVYSVGCEAVPVKSREPFESAEPQKAARVAHDPLDRVMRQAISRGVGLDRQALGLSGQRCSNDKQDR